MLHESGQFGMEKMASELEEQRDTFLNWLAHTDSGLSEQEIASLRGFDVAGKSQYKVILELAEILGSSERADSVWDQYRNRLAEIRAIEPVIEDLRVNGEKSGPLAKYIDWDLVEEGTEHISMIDARKGDIICNTDNLGDALYFVADGEVRYKSLDASGNPVIIGDARPNNYFGEQALLYERIIKSEHSVTSETAKVMKIDADLVLDALDSHKTHELDLSRPGKLEIDISPELSAKLLEAGKVSFARQNVALLTEGAGADKVYIMLEGKANIFRDSQKLCEVRPGQFFGEAELFSEDDANSCSVITEWSSVFLEFEGEEFKAILEQYPDFAVQLQARAEQRINFNSEQADSASDYDFEFKKMSGEKAEIAEIKKGILDEARITIAQIKEINPEVDEQKLRELFNFLCGSLEDQQVNDPRQYVPHGAKHTLSVIRFSDSFMSSSEIFKQNIIDLYGEEKGRVLLRLAASLHDIGYVDLAYDETMPKWKHQEFSAERTEKELPYERMNELIGLTPEQYDSFLKAIFDHGSDNPDKKQVAAGRRFVPGDNRQDPILEILRIADNLDLSEGRLNNVQRSPEFLRIMKRLFKVCQDYVGQKRDKTLGKELRQEKMTEIVEEEMDKLHKEHLSSGASDERKKFLMDLENDLFYAVEYDNWSGINHYEWMSVAENAFAREEMDHKGRMAIRVFVEYNTPAEMLDPELAKMYQHRLHATFRHPVNEDANSDALKIYHKNAQGEDEEVVIRFMRVFPAQGATPKHKPNIEFPQAVEVGQHNEKIA